MRKHRLLVAVLAMACAGQVRGQTPPDDDRDLTGRAARILMQLSADQRDAFTQKLAGMSPEERRAALRELVARHGGAAPAPAPDIGSQLQQMWQALPAKERQRLLGEAMKNLKQLPPEQQRAILEQVRRMNQAPGDPPKDPAAPNTPQEPRSVLGDALDQLDDVLERHGDRIESTVIQLEEYLAQAREYLQMYRGMQPEQRDAVRRELEEGLRIFLEENVLPEVESRFEGLRELRQESARISALVKEYMDLFQRLPAEEREQILKDLAITGKQFFDETIRPEIDKQVQDMRTKLDELRKLPREERRKRVREALRRLFD